MNLPNNKSVSEPSIWSLFCLIVLLFPIFLNAQLRKGDLIFLAEGKSDFSSAISSATASEGELSFVHVGIIDIDSIGNTTVIEASPEAGVCRVSLDLFLKNSAKICGKPGAVVKRLSIPFPVEETINNAVSYMGEPYDWWYLPDNGKMYCSELIYESFLNNEAHHIFKSAPMNFRAPDGTMPEFWIQLFNKLGLEVPEGIEGTNPNDLYRDPRLQEVLRYF